MMHLPTALRRSLLRLAAGLAMSAAAGVAGAQSTWLGGDGDWNDPDMWELPGVPTGSDDVFIDGGKLGFSSKVVMFSTAYTNEQHARNLTIDLNDLLRMENNRRLTLHGDQLVNNGKLELLSTGAVTGLYLTADNTTFSGAGTVWMRGDSKNSVVGRSNYLYQTPSILTNELQHTIRGAGQLGTNESVNAIGLDNHGLILADGASSATRPLTINLQPNATVRSNDGILRAQDGGQLRFYTSVLTNAHLVEALDGSSVLLEGSVIEGGTLRTVGTGRIDLQNLTVTLAGLRDLTLDGQARVVNGKGAFIAGTIVNQGGDIRLDSLGASTGLRIDGNVALAGNGSLTMSDSAFNFITGAANTNVLTQESMHTIQGSGVFGGPAAGNQIGLDNRGTVIANNAANGLTINLTDGAGITRANSGTLRAELGGVLTLQGTVLDNTGGTVEARDASKVVLVNSTLQGGTVHTAGSGAVEMRSDSRLIDVTINSQVVMLNGYRSFLQGTITNNGRITLEASAGNADLRIDGDVTLAGSGVLATTDASSNRIYGVASGDTLTNGPLHTIRGSGSIGTSASGIGLLNQGLVDASQTVKLSIDPSAAAGVVRNAGILRGSGSGGLELKGGSFDNQGMVEALDGSNVTYTSTAVTANNNAGTLTGGTWRAASQGAGATLTLRGDAVATNDATVYLKGPGSVIQVDATPLDDSLQRNQGALYVTTGRVFGATANGGHFANAGTLQVDSLAVFHATSIDNTGGIVTGNGGIVKGDVFGSGTIVPGNSTGHLTVEGNLEQGAAGAMTFELASLGDFDRLTVTGDLTLAGELAIWNAGYSPVVGDSFVIVTFGQRSGGSQFGSLSKHGFGAGVDFAVSYRANDVRLEVTAVPEPATWAMLLAGIGLLGSWVMRGSVAGARQRLNGGRLRQGSDGQPAQPG